MGNIVRALKNQKQRFDGYRRLSRTVQLKCSQKIPYDARLALQIYNFCGTKQGTSKTFIANNFEFVNMILLILYKTCCSYIKIDKLYANINCICLLFSCIILKLVRYRNQNTDIFHRSWSQAFERSEINGAILKSFECILLNTLKQ